MRQRGRPAGEFALPGTGDVWGGVAVPGERRHEGPKDKQGVPLQEQGTPFHQIIYNRDLTGGNYIDQTQVFFRIAEFTAPTNQLAVITGVSCFPDQLEALSDLYYQITVQGIAVPFFSQRYGQIGVWGVPESWRIDVPQSQVFKIEAALSTTYRQSQSGADHRIEFTTHLYGVYVRAR